MTALRIFIAAVLVACAVPVILLTVAWVTSALSGCTLQFEEPNICSLGSAHVGWLLDDLVRIGVWGALSFGLAVYAFAAWVMAELAAIVLGALRRG